MRKPLFSQAAAVRCNSSAPAVSISAMPAMSISPVKSGVGGIGTRRRLSAVSSCVASATVQAPVATRRKVVPLSSTRKPGARACVGRTT